MKLSRGDQSNTMKLQLSIELIQVNQMPINSIGIRLDSVVVRQSKFYIFLYDSFDLISLILFNCFRFPCNQLTVNFR